MDNSCPIVHSNKNLFSERLLGDLQEQGPPNSTCITVSSPLFSVLSLVTLPCSYHMLLPSSTFLLAFGKRSNLRQLQRGTIDIFYQEINYVILSNVVYQSTYLLKSPSLAFDGHDFTTGQLSNTVITLLLYLIIIPYSIVYNI